MLDCHLFTWKPDLWHWETIHEDGAVSRSGKTIVHRWSCGRIKNITSGSRGLLIRLGTDRPALIGVGKSAKRFGAGARWPVHCIRDQRSEVSIDRSGSESLGIDQAPGLDEVNLSVA